jgi:hypothetical protein
LIAAPFHVISRCLPQLQKAQIDPDILATVHETLSQITNNKELFISKKAGSERAARAARAAIIAKE